MSNTRGVRSCPVCGEEMIPEFGSPCEDPLAWTCGACGAFQLETGGRPLTEEQAAIVHELARSAGQRRIPREHPAAAVRAAREILAAFDLTVPVDVERTASLLGYPIDWVSRPPGERGGIARWGSAHALVLNRDYPFASEQERRWVVAEELGHAVLGHRALAASDRPGRSTTLVEPRRRREERDAHAFAAELLMPAAELRARFKQAEPELRGALGGRDREEVLRRVVAELARAFGVSLRALRRRLEELRLLD